MSHDFEFLVSSMRMKAVSKHASCLKEWAKLGCPNPVQKNASLVGMGHLKSKLVPVKLANG